MPRPSALHISGAVAFVFLVYVLLSGHATPAKPHVNFDSSDLPDVQWTVAHTIYENSHSNLDSITASRDHVPPTTRLPTSHTAKTSTASRTTIIHPTGESIPDLIKEAEVRLSRLLKSESKSLESAAAQYREVRSRHPPPGFDKWFEYAQKHDAIMVEEFWDQIYHDLEPFWAIDPKVIRTQARELGMAVMVEDGHAVVKTDWFWHVIWKKMIDEVAFMLSDMVIPLNTMDESRLMVPWKKINELVSSAAMRKAVSDLEEVSDKVKGWREGQVEEDVETPVVEWSTHSPPYSYARAACAPDTPIHNDRPLLKSESAYETDARTNKILKHQFVANSTWWSDTCSDAAIGAYHGALMSPLTSSTTDVLQPLFGGSKFSVNNEILVPAPMYWNGEDRFEAGDPFTWSEKQGTAIWRGTATGGRHNALNWPHFHRHRFNALANGTKYADADEHDKIFTPAQIAASTKNLPRPIKDNLASWLDSKNNIAFTDLFCDIPNPEDQWGWCWYLNDEFMLAPALSLSEQYSNKFLPDIDGNSFSGRYRTFLFSNSLPFKATLYREWHDSRLIAWKHFVPMNNRFTDYYALMAYFAGCSADVCGEEIAPHDEDAEMIATAGSEWAKKVLRKEDMQIYVGRLLLEYARVTDDDRDNLGWVKDLLPQDDDLSISTDG